MILSSAFKCTYLSFFKKALRYLSNINWANPYVSQMKYFYAFSANFIFTIAWRYSLTRLRAQKYGSINYWLCLVLIVLYCFYSRSWSSNLVLAWQACDTSLGLNLIKVTMAKLCTEFVKLYEDLHLSLILSLHFSISMCAPEYAIIETCIYTTENEILIEMAYQNLQ